ncbi:MAG: hypothetical protein J6A01_00375, partial [Proteobacteria bacterium]|nr:hypothetical protein [Pseudomonadota bacterium]
MKNWSIIIAMSASIAGISGCAQKQEAPVEVPKAAHVYSIEKLDLPVIFNTAEDAKKVCDINLGHIERLRGEITAITGKHTQENTLERFNEMDIAFERILGVTELMANTHPEESVRTEAENCQTRAAHVLTDVQMDTKLYAAMNEVDKST